MEAAPEGSTAQAQQLCFGACAESASRLNTSGAAACWLPVRGLWGGWEKRPATPGRASAGAAPAGPVLTGRRLPGLAAGGGAVRLPLRWGGGLGAGEAASSARCGTGGPPKPPGGACRCARGRGAWRGGRLCSAPNRCPLRAVRWEARAVQCEIHIFVLVFFLPLHLLCVLRPLRPLHKAKGDESWAAQLFPSPVRGEQGPPSTSACKQSLWKAWT